jgi:hypothetical protein
MCFVVSVSFHLKHLTSVAMFDLKALFCFKIVLFRLLKTVSFVLDGCIDRESTLYALRKVAFVEG